MKNLMLILSFHRIDFSGYVALFHLTAVAEIEFGA